MLQLVYYGQFIKILKLIHIKKGIIKGTSIISFGSSSKHTWC